VSGPAALARRMRALRPYVGRLVQDLDGLRRDGLALLLLFAPDAPAVPARFDVPGLRVATLPGERDLYRITGLPPGPGPDEVVFGLVGGVFVVASDERRAREIAGAPDAAAPGPGGGAVASADLSTVRRIVEESTPLPLDTAFAERAEVGVSATRAALDVTLHLQLR